MNRPAPRRLSALCGATLVAALTLLPGSIVGPGAVAAGAVVPSARLAPAGARVMVSPVPRRVALDRRVVVRGQVVDGSGAPVGGSGVEVEVSTRGGWAAVPGSTSVADALGRFRLPAPTFYYGRHVFRVVAPTATGTAVSPSRAITVRTPFRPAGRAGAGRVDPARFDPCTAVPYRINFSGAPGNARSLVAAALHKARAATGLTFVYAGSYAGIPFSRQGDGGLPASGIGFAWTTPREVRGLAGSAIGLGGGWTSGRRRTSSGVVIDRTFHYRRGWTGANSIGGLVLHELGHALGLEHVSDPQQQMYPLDIGAPHGDYNRGDLAALRRIGLDAGCL
ncbi:matrixin family metalloprotease [Nocardioides terrae]|nr:matrixin family metalloprotease [Nocardioides terrae]